MKIKSYAETLTTTIPVVREDLNRSGGSSHSSLPKSKDGETSTRSIVASVLSKQASKKFREGDLVIVN